MGMRVVAQTPVGLPNQGISAPVQRSAEAKVHYGYSMADRAVVRRDAQDFPDLRMPEADRSGLAVMRFRKSKLVELEGYGDFEKAKALLAPMGLEPVPTPSGHARVSVGSKKYRMLGGQFAPQEVWVAVVVRPVSGGPVGQAYLHTLTDSWLMNKIGAAWGIPYERGGIDMANVALDRTDTVNVVGADGQTYARLQMCAESPLATREFAQEMDFRAYSPTGRQMEVHIEGLATSRPFDLHHDAWEFRDGSAMEQLLTSLDFAPRRWVSHDRARGAIRAGVGSRNKV